MNKDYLANACESAIKRENSKFYISISAEEEREMLKSVGAASLQDMFSHIDTDERFTHVPEIGAPMDAQKVYSFVEKIAGKNKIPNTSFLEGDWNVPQVLVEISGIRGLSTAYTPY